MVTYRDWAKNECKSSQWPNKNFERPSKKKAWRIALVLRKSGFLEAKLKK